MTPQYVEFDHGSNWYGRVLPFRNGILREPLGIEFTEHDLQAERGQFHFALVDGEVPVACLVAKPVGDCCFQLRQMAVAEQHRGTGLGRQLIEQVEAALRERGATELRLHARTDAVGFYLKLGYTTIGQELIEVTIPHQEMVKQLA